MSTFEVTAGRPEGSRGSDGGLGLWSRLEVERKSGAFERAATTERKQITKITKITQRLFQNCT